MCVVESSHRNLRQRGIYCCFDVTDSHKNGQTANNGFFVYVHSVEGVRRVKALVLSKGRVCVCPSLYALLSALQ